ncbi:MAG: flagellar hook-associated protein 2 [Planctomycetota bacterium]|jgi:flagellar hook-associated protein 2
MVISFGGLASGLDTNAIIQALVGVERLPIGLLEAKKTVQSSKLDLIGTFKGLIKGLQTAADELRSTDKFYDYLITPSDESVASFTSTGEAESGAHTLKVLSLAQADRWAFDGVLDSSVDLASADGEQVDFSVNGTNYSIALTQAGSSLNDIANEINSLAGDDVTASVVNVGTGSSPSYQLVLAGKDTGEDFRITGISSTVAGLSIDGAGPDGAGVAQSSNNVTVGSNAVAIIDGLQVERDGNDFTNVIDGVDITVQAADPDWEITFSVEPDKALVKEKINAFLEAYNGVINFSNEQSKYSEDGGKGGQLFGDSILRSVRSTLNSALFNVPTATVLADSEGYSTLSLVGLKTSSDGTMTMDETIFDEKFGSNVQALADLFVDSDGFDNGGAAEGTAEFYVDTTSDSGLAEKLYRAIDLMFDSIPGVGGAPSTEGLFGAREESLQDSIDQLQDSLDAKERYLEIFEEQLVAKYSALEQLIGGLNSQGAALQNILVG